MIEAGHEDMDVGPVVSLREVRPDDLPVLFAYQADPEANRIAVFGAIAPSDRAAFDAKWASILADPGAAVRVVVADGMVAGSVMRWRDPKLDGPEVSYWIGRELWGRGIATSALRLFLQRFPERPLYGRAASSNTGSLRVLEKCGFRRVRVEHDIRGTSGELVDEIVLRLDDAARVTVGAGR